jgi:hypothetical protein
MACKPVIFQVEYLIDIAYLSAKVIVTTKPSGPISKQNKPKPLTSSQE